MPANNSPYKTFSDQQLLRLLKVSSELAFTEIYNRYHPLMISFAFKKLQDQDLTADMVQDLFLKLWEKRESLVESGNLAAYLYIVLRSRIMDYFAHGKVKTKYLEVLTHAMGNVLPENTDHLVRERIMDAYIQRQIKGLPPKMQVVFEYSRKQHLSHKEIAEMLGTTEDNISKHITKALKILRSKLSMLFF